MTHDDIIRMAREACPYTDDVLRGAFYDGYLQGAAAEREACAKVCEEHEKANLYGVKECAVAIRARGNA